MSARSQRSPAATPRCGSRSRSRSRKRSSNPCTASQSASALASALFLLEWLRKMRDMLQNRRGSVKWMTPKVTPVSGTVAIWSALSPSSASRPVRVKLAPIGVGLGVAACPSTPEIGRRPVNYAERQFRTLQGTMGTCRNRPRAALWSAALTVSCRARTGHHYCGKTQPPLSAARECYVRIHRLR